VSRVDTPPGLTPRYSPPFSHFPSPFSLPSDFRGILCFEEVDPTFPFFTPWVGFAEISFLHFKTTRGVPSCPRPPLRGLGRAVSSTPAGQVENHILPYLHPLPSLLERKPFLLSPRVVIFPGPLSEVDIHSHPLRSPPHPGVSTPLPSTPPRTADKKETGFTFLWFFLRPGVREDSR